jgi:uncharacterized protein YhaN
MVRAMGRVEERIFRLNDEIEALRSEEQLVFEELQFHRHIDDDAQRDAAVTELPADRSFALSSSADVARFERALEELRRRREALEEKRDCLLERLL